MTPLAGIGALLLVAAAAYVLRSRKRNFYYLWRLLAGGADARLADRKAALFAPYLGTPTLTGHVVEIGAGLGHGLKWYATPSMARLTLIEPNVLFHPRLAAAVAAAGLPASVTTILGASAAALPLGDASVDAVVSMLTLCSVPSVGAAVAEAHRVLRPGGRLFLLEHVCPPASDYWAGLTGGLLRDSGMWWAVGDGCQLDRHTGEVACGAGVWEKGADGSPGELVRFALGGGAPSFLKYHVAGVLTKAGR